MKTTKQRKSRAKKHFFIRAEYHDDSRGQELNLSYLTVKDAKDYTQFGPVWRLDHIYQAVADWHKYA
jgi:hypothetical protein